MTNVSGELGRDIGGSQYEWTHAEEKFAQRSFSELPAAVSFAVPDFQTVENARVLVNSMG